MTDAELQDHSDTIEWRRSITGRIGNLEETVSFQAKQQTQHMEQTARIEQNTTDLIETFTALKGAWRVLDWVGKASKPIAVVGSVGIGILWVRDHFTGLFK